MTDNATKYQQLLETIPCNYCGQNDYQVVYPPRYELAKPDEIAQTFRSSGDELLLDQLVRCKQCGLQYLNPRLRSDVVIQGYSVGEDETFVSQAEGRERTFARGLKLIERYRPGRGAILDVGTAGGSFLAVAQRAGWQVFGCEPNRWMAEWGQTHYGLEILAGTVHDLQLPADSIDVVTLWDVLEHVPDPARDLAACHRVLKPGGLLVVNYPDIDSLVARLMGRRWVFLLSIHLWYFTPTTIAKVLDQAGFRVLARRRHWQSLELGYILFRMEAYLGGLARAAGKLARALGLTRLQFPYWVGQTLVLAEKKASQA